jgi:hypothetical protein
MRSVRTTVGIRPIDWRRPEADRVTGCSSTTLVLGLAALAMFAHDVATGTNGAAVAGAGASVLGGASVILIEGVLEDIVGSFGVATVLEQGANSTALGDGVNSFVMASVLKEGANSLALRDGVNSFGIATDFALGAGVNEYSGGMFSFALPFGLSFEARDGQPWIVDGPIPYV